MLFFREDVHHRTQDASQHRVALIVDIMRLPLRSTPLSKIAAGEEAHRVVTSGRNSGADDFMDVLRSTGDEAGWACSRNNRGEVQC